MKKPTWVYALLNGLFHGVHISIIIFVMIGWIFPSLRLAHLVLGLLTLGSWFILGLWFGTGYCPISDWHWKLKAALGGGQPQSSYIHHLLQTLLQRELHAETVDKAVLIGTVLVTALSLALNVTDWLT